MGRAITITTAALGVGVARVLAKRDLSQAPEIPGADLSPVNIIRMKLLVLHEEDGPTDPFGEFLKSKIMRRVLKGDSLLKKLVRGTGVTLDHVRLAIKSGDCLRPPGEKALGPTYLEQAIANILRDMVTDNELPLAQLNDARRYFGLTVLTMKALRKEKKQTVGSSPPTQ